MGHCGRQGSGAARIAQLRGFERRAPPDDEVWIKTWVEPGGGRPDNTTNRRSRGAFYIYRSKRAAGSYRVFPVHTSGGGRQTVLMPMPAAGNIPELFTCAKPPRHARTTISRGCWLPGHAVGARGLRSDRQGTKAKTWFGIVRNNREHSI